MIYAIRIEEGGPTLDAMNFIALPQEKFRKVCPVLPGNAGNESLFHDCFRLLYECPAPLPQTSQPDEN